MITDIEKTIREYLPSTLHMSLATCVDNRPRVCEVHFVYDKNLNLYFRSKEERRHSKEILENNLVAWSIVYQHQVWEKVRGIYFEWVAQKIIDVDPRSEVNKQFQKRLLKTEKFIKEQMESGGHKYYKIQVSKRYIFDAKESNPGTKYELTWS